MIKIIKNGNDKIFITRCAECASDLTYELSDVQRKKDEDNFYAHYSYPYITCPVCYASTYVNLVTEEDNKKASFPAFMPTSYCCPN